MNIIFPDKFTKNIFTKFLTITKISNKLPLTLQIHPHSKIILTPASICGIPAISYFILRKLDLLTVNEVNFAKFDEIISSIIQILDLEETILQLANSSAFSLKLAQFHMSQIQFLMRKVNLKVQENSSFGMFEMDVLIACLMQGMLEKFVNEARKEDFVDCVRFIRMWTGVQVVRFAGLKNHVLG